MTLRFVPDTLFGRLISALLAVVAITILIFVALIVRERRAFLFTGGEAGAIANAVAETSISLAALSGEARAAEIARLAADSITISRSGDFRQPLNPNDYTAALDSLRSRLERALPAGFGFGLRPARPGPRTADEIRVRTQARRGEGFGRREGEGLRDALPFGGFRGGEPSANGGGPSANAGGPGGSPGTSDGPGGPVGSDGGFGSGPRYPRGGGGFPGEVEVAVALPDGAEVLFRTDVPRAGPPLSIQIFVEIGALTLVLGVVLYLMARTITRPLTRLARAADAVGRGERQAPLPESGARELREATHAFNVMQERLHRYLDSRTGVLAALSHDLRTPLTRLKLRVETLDDDSLRERFGADLDEMIAMVANCLNLFKGLDDEAPQQTDVGALLADLRREFAELGGAVDIEGEAKAPVVVKPQALKRCLTNLLSNAIKYGERATVVVEDGADLVLRVLDEGPGIPPESLEQVFEPFFRLESSRNSTTGGVGLGLGIARDIAQAHGGSLVLRNRSPHGLEAVLTLPKAPVRAA
ncbi:MAG TPA: ATP-binding protein [Gammaproteobacteria bacterium]|nr:ATP-binding protein [Gammaproteobacteria bacterium]